MRALAPSSEVTPIPLARVLRRCDRQTMTVVNRFAQAPTIELDRLGSMRWLGFTRSTWETVAGVQLVSASANMTLYFDRREALCGDLATLGMAIPADALAFLAEIHLAPLLYRLEEIFGARFSVSHLVTAAPHVGADDDRSVDIAFRLDDEAGSERYRGCLRLPKSFAARATLGQRGVASVSETLRSLPMTLCACVGVASLTQQEIEALAVGHWVQLADTPNPSTSDITRKECWLYSPLTHQSWLGRRVSGNDMELTQRLESGDLNQPLKLGKPRMEPSDRNTQRSTKFELDASAVELTVHFEIGRTQMPLGQLNDIGVGSVVNFERALSDAPVRLIVNDREVARGELVLVGESLGVCIERLMI
ncbi:MAG: FliM/FliN family flagellar motor switch protein [Casimicrobium sp.]